MKADIEIARSIKLKPIKTYLETLGISDDECESYGRYTSKIKLNVLEKFKDKPNGKLILVTAMTPTSKGEGKTLTSVGLGQAINKIGKRGIIALREPSVGPVFGIKGGATGGGHSQVLPMEMINLQFNGDFDAITAAHNLLAALIDNHIHKGNELGINPTQILWPRTMDMNDRALRQIVIGLGGKVNGVPREGGFVITAASEIMAILALATSRANLKERMGEIVIAYTYGGDLVRAKDLGAHKAMAVLLNNAIMPNLVQTSEHTPALIHAGPFANIAHGTNSVLADKIALKLADYVVTESGFAADLGAEKFFDIVCRDSGIYPSAVVIVATCRAIRQHGLLGDAKFQDNEESISAFNSGLENLRVHIENMRKFDVPVMVTINKFPDDTERELTLIKEFCDAMDVECAEHEAFAKGGDGAIELAEKAVKLADSNPNPKAKYLYSLDKSIEEKIETIAKEIYRADGVYIENGAKKRIKKFTEAGYGNLPICIAKTQSSISDTANAYGVPKGWHLTVTDVNISAGAGFLVVVCGNMMLMPGLPKHPASLNMDVDEDGEITGLF